MVVDVDVLKLVVITTVDGAQREGHLGGNFPLDAGGPFDGVGRRQGAVHLGGGEGGLKNRVADSVIGKAAPVYSPGVEFIGAAHRVGSLL